MKKKESIQNEKQRLHQEEAARLREEKRLRRRKEKKQAAVVMLLVGLGAFVVSLVFFGLHVARMRDFELNYVRMYGTVTDFKIHHASGTHSMGTTHYSYVFTYRYEGKTYKATDSEAYSWRNEEMLGEKVEIYVNPAQPERAARVKTADGYSIMAAVPFVISLLAFSVGGLTLVGLKGGGYAKRILFVWLPELLFCAAYILLFALGLPHDGVAAIYARTRGAIWVSVGGGAVIVAAAIDGLITYKSRPKDIDGRVASWRRLKK